jgi:hypothetical protein
MLRNLSTLPYVKPTLLPVPSTSLSLFDALQSGPNRRTMWTGMPVKTMSTKLASKGFLGYMNDVRELYPPLPDAVQDLARADSTINRGKHEYIPACLGCSATQAEPHLHQCTVRCLECKYVRMAGAITRWKAQNTRYDLTDITLSRFSYPPGNAR